MKMLWRCVLENRIPPHKKSYMMTLRENFSVQVHWGRIGARPQERTHDFANIRMARAFIETVMAEKVHKGYKIVEQDDFKIVHHEDDSPDPKVAVDEIKIKEQKDDNEVVIKDGFFIV